LGVWDWIDDNNNNWGVSMDTIWNIVVIVLFVVVLAWITNGGKSDGNQGNLGKSE
jgi:hypothetical protein